MYEEVKRIAKSHGLSIADVERKLGFPRSSMAKWDKSSPGIDKVIAVADLLGESVDAVIGRGEKEKVPVLMEMYNNLDFGMQSRLMEYARMLSIIQKVGKDG